MSFFEFPHTRTYDSDLGWIIKTMKQICEMVESLDEWKIEHEEEYEELKNLYDSIMSGRFPPEIVEAFNKWAATNMPSLVKEMIFTVFFGITEDGFFYADIPESWEMIIFNTTGYDILVPGEEFGHLVLSY